MQVTNSQVIKTLASLGRDEPKSTPPPGDSRPAAVDDDMVAQVTELPPVRRERAEMARDRISGDDLPSAEVLAEKLVGRLVCDRLR